jgi:hypothetical protein
MVEGRMLDNSYIGLPVTVSLGIKQETVGLNLTNLQSQSYL